MIYDNAWMDKLKALKCNSWIVNTSGIQVTGLTSVYNEVRWHILYKFKDIFEFRVWTFIEKSQLLLGISHVSFLNVFFLFGISCTKLKTVWFFYKFILKLNFWVYAFYRPTNLLYAIDVYNLSICNIELLWPNVVHNVVQNRIPKNNTIRNVI